MKPRLTSSKKWTPFPKDYLTQIQSAFNEAFPAQLKTGKLILEGRIYPEEILLRVGYLESGRLLQNNFEVSIGYSSKKQDALERIHNCIDAAASMMNEYFESDGVVDFPLQWKDFDFDGHPIWVQYTTVNTDLEAEADRLLGLEKDSLVVEELDSEDALARSEEIIPSSLGDDDSDPDSEAEEAEVSNKPTMFSKRKKTKKDNLH